LVYKAPQNSPGSLASDIHTSYAINGKSPTQTLYQKLRKGLKNVFAGAALTLASCAGMPTQEEYASQAKEAYLSFITASNSQDLQQKYSPESLRSIIDAHKLYRQAEDADKSSEKFRTELAKTSSAGKAVAAKALSLAKDRDTFYSLDQDAFDEGFLSNLPPEDQQRYERVRSKYSSPAPVAPAATPVPAVQPAQPVAPAYQPATPAPAVQPAQPAAPAATPVPVVPKNKFVEDRAALSMDIGSMRSSQDRAAALDLRAYGITAIAQGHADKYREETSLDKTRDTGFGVYAKADLDEMVGIPFNFGASAYLGTQTRGSQESQLQEDANFRIATVTDTDQKDTNNSFAVFGQVKLNDTKIGATIYTGSNETKVGVTTDLDVVNKNDPAGNYHRNWTDTYKFLTDTTGVQLSLDQMLAKGIDVGAYLTLDLMELKEMQRNVNTYTLDVFLKAITEDNKYGASVLIGQGLLDDNGEQNDMFTKPRYSMVAGAELTDWLTLGLQFNRMENPDGSLMFLIGANSALPYMINNRWTNNMSRLDLLKDMPPELQNVYLRGLFNDFTWAIAQQNVWAVSGDVGARRVQTLNEGAKTVFNGSATLYIPVHSTFTGTITPFLEHDGLEGLVQRQGVRVGGHAVGQRWHFFAEASREKADGRAQKDEDFRAVGGIAFPFGK
jgi:hypothetical protein